LIASEHQKQIRDSNILVYNFDFDKEFVLYSKTTSKSSEIYSQLRGFRKSDFRTFHLLYRGVTHQSDTFDYNLTHIRVKRLVLS